MVTFKYKNISDQPQVLVGIGTVEPGATVVADHEISNPNFELQFDGDRKVGVDPHAAKPTRKSK